MNMLSGAEEGAQGAPFESYKLAAVRLAEAVRLASRGNDSENDMVLELSGAVNLFLRETGIALAFGNALEDLEGVPNFGSEFSELTTDGFAKDLQALPWISIRPYRDDECGAYIENNKTGTTVHVMAVLRQSGVLVCDLRAVVHSHAAGFRVRVDPVAGRARATSACGRSQVALTAHRRAALCRS